jgi:hypothetical protein
MFSTSKNNLVTTLLQTVSFVFAFLKRNNVYVVLYKLFQSNKWEMHLQDGMRKEQNVKYTIKRVKIRKLKMSIGV